MNTHGTVSRVEDRLEAGPECACGQEVGSPRGEDGGSCVGKTVRTQGERYLIASPLGDEGISVNRMNILRFQNQVKG